MNRTFFRRRRRLVLGLAFAALAAPAAGQAASTGLQPLADGSAASMAGPTAGFSVRTDSQQSMIDRHRALGNLNLSSKVDLGPVETDTVIHHDHLDTTIAGTDAVTWMLRFNGTMDVTPTLSLQGFYMYRAPMKIEGGRFSKMQFTNFTLRKKLDLYTKVAPFIAPHAIVTKSIGQSGMIPAGPSSGFQAMKAGMRNSATSGLMNVPSAAPARPRIIDVAVIQNTGTGVVGTPAPIKEEKDLEPYERVFANTAYWKRIGEEFQERWLVKAFREAFAMHDAARFQLVLVALHQPVERVAKRLLDGGVVGLARAVAHLRAAVGGDQDRRQFGAEAGEHLLELRDHPNEQDRGDQDRHCKNAGRIEHGLTDLALQRLDAFLVGRQRVEHDAVYIYIAELSAAGAREVQQVVDDLRGPERLLDDLVQQPKPLLVALQLLRQHLCVGGNHRQRRVDLMRDPRRQQSNRRKLVGLRELGLQFHAFRDVVHDD